MFVEFQAAAESIPLFFFCIGNNQNQWVVHICPSKTKYFRVLHSCIQRWCATGRCAHALLAFIIHTYTGDDESQWTGSSDTQVASSRAFASSFYMRAPTMYVFCLYFLCPPWLMSRRLMHSVVIVMESFQFHYVCRSCPMSQYRYTTSLLLLLLIIVLDYCFKTKPSGGIITTNARHFDNICVRVVYTI